jgi:hypothetical protein
MKTIREDKDEEESGEGSDTAYFDGEDDEFNNRDDYNSEEEKEF